MLGSISARRSINPDAKIGPRERLATPRAHWLQLMISHVQDFLPDPAVDDDGGDFGDAIESAR
jgi:hypothetical protein